MIKECLLAFISSLGFGILFNIRGNKLFWAAIGGTISWFIYILMKYYGLNEYGALFVSSITFSIYSEICARILKTPVTTIIICSLIPLVPGSGMYYTMYEIVSGHSSNAMNIGLTTIASAGVLAVGILFVSTLTRQVTNFRSVKHTLFTKK